MKKVLLATLLLASAICSAQTVPIVINCPPLALTGDDSRGYLNVTQGTCTFIPNTHTQSITYDSNILTLTNPATIDLTTGMQDVDKNLGYASIWITVTLPNTAQRNFRLYIDQGTLLQSSLDQKQWPLTMTLPAGTTFQVHASLFGTATSCGAGCIFASVWELQGHI